MLDWLSNALLAETGAKRLIKKKKKDNRQTNNRASARRGQQVQPADQYTQIYWAIVDSTEAIYWAIHAQAS